MIKTDTLFQDMINSPVRELRARVELYSGSTLLNTFKYTNRLISFSVERTGDESKFFGYGVCQKLNVKLIDKNRELDITTSNTLEVVFGVGSDYVYALPVFKVSEVHRDENTNVLSITAYDALYAANALKTDKIPLNGYAYNIAEYAKECAAVLGLPLKIENVNDDSFSTYYPQGANFEGTETIREALNAIAEATQTIYFINNEWELVFKRLDMYGAPAITIDKEKYFSLKSKTNRRLVGITHATQLGDNVAATMPQSGTIQYIRDNPLWEMRNDIAALVENALSAVGGFTINQFECEWRGNYLLEIGDKIALITKDNETVYSYLLNDNIEYNGAYKQKSRWEYTNEESETADNPTTLGEALKQTYAKVDKINKNISIVASDVSNNKKDIVSIFANTESITASVSSLEQATNTALGSVNEELASIGKKVEAQLTDENVRIQIQTELNNGVNKVITNTGFVLDDVGLTIDKSGKEMKTQITEDGMTVFKADEAVLTANNMGVDAVNLSASTYLIIGTNSRFENYKGNRTACFFIGSD